MKRLVIHNNQQKRMSNGKILKIMYLGNLILLMSVLTFKLTITNRDHLSNLLKYQSHPNLINNPIKIKYYNLLTIKNLYAKKVNRIRSQ